MSNIISLFQEIFLLKENDDTKVGLSTFKESSTPVEKVIKPKRKEPQALKLSDLMRKSSSY